MVNKQKRFEDMVNAGETINILNAKLTIHECQFRFTVSIQCEVKGEIFDFFIDSRLSSSFGKMDYISKLEAAVILFNDKVKYLSKRRTAPSSDTKVNTAGMTLEFEDVTSGEKRFLPITSSELPIVLNLYELTDEELANNRIYLNTIRQL